ncbi:MAG: acetyl-CoA carboxylase biotin carboxyl carrier protein [Phycisphaerae bacterium]|nr:acetyl-CoA carboxylase biotin carboxyl carrier protein [Phycisphaerae bacterium]
MIDPARLKQLVQLMVDNDLTELDLREGEATVTIKRGGAAPVPAAPVVVHAPAPVHAGAANGSVPAADAGLLAIESPMVGTFYSAPNPDSPAFVKPGSKIAPDSVVCLIEAMKVFNEIKADKGGVIEQVLAKNGQAVEFGQKLFLVRPA